MYERCKQEFESNVILDIYKTSYIAFKTYSMFESNVILDIYKTPSFRTELDGLV